MLYAFLKVGKKAVAAQAFEGLAQRFVGSGSKETESN